MLFSFTINGKQVDPNTIFRNQRSNTSNSNPYQNANNNVNQYEMDYIRKHGYPQTCIDKRKMKEYEKAMREITIIDDIEIKDPFKEEKNIDKQEEVIISNISGNQV